MSLGVAYRMHAEAWKDGDYSWVDIKPPGGPEMRITHEIMRGLGGLPGGPFPPDNPYPSALLYPSNATFGLGALAGPGDGSSHYTAAFIAVDILRDFAPRAPETKALLQRVDAYAAAEAAAEAGGGEAPSPAVAQKIEVEARAALRDALRRKELFSGFVGAAIVGTVALGGWYAFKLKRRKR